MPIAPAVEHQAEVDAAALKTEGAVLAQWQTMTADLEQSWSRVGPKITQLTMAGQLTAAISSNRFVPQSLTTQGLSPARVAAPRPAAVVGVDQDGRPLDTLLYQAVVTTKNLLDQGTPLTQAFQQGGNFLSNVTITQVAEAARNSEMVGMAVSPAVTSWVRMVNPGACSRCIMLAGRHYWLDHFQRHPRCRCTHVPSGDKRAEGVGTVPRDYFDSLTREQQDATFTKDGAQAIRDGADMSQVVNARNGRRGQGNSMYITEAGYHATYEGTRPRSVGARAMRLNERPARAPAKSRLMPDAIYQIARDRDEAIAMLKFYGYIVA